MTAKAKDISWLNSPVRGNYYYLYMIVDVYSRLITGWEIHETESAEQAAALIRKARLRHGIGLNQSEMVLHSDNGRMLFYEFGRDTLNGTALVMKNLIQRIARLLKQ